MELYISILKNTMIPLSLVIITGVLSVMFLYGSNLIAAGGNKHQLPGVNYRFNPSDYLNAFLGGGGLSLIVIYVAPLLNEIPMKTHWTIPLIISLLVTQSMIDSRYFELADEWTFVLSLCVLIYQYTTGNLTLINMQIVAILFALSFLSSMLFDMPGFGDVKLLLFGGFLINNWGSLGSFLRIIFLVPLIISVVEFVIDKIKYRKNNVRLKDVQFAFGPYIVLGFLALLAGVI